MPIGGVYIDIIMEVHVLIYMHVPIYGKYLHIKQQDFFAKYHKMFYNK